MQLLAQKAIEKTKDGGYITGIGLVLIGGVGLIAVALVCSSGMNLVALEKGASPLILMSLGILFRKYKRLANAAKSAGMATTKAGLPRTTE
jgi:hypothetical protein